MSTIANLGAMGIVAIIIAIVATVLAFIFIVPEKRRAQMGAFGKFLHDTCNFKYLIVEKILQALYIFATAYVILAGFFMLFMAPQDWFTGTRHWLGGYGLLTMIVGPIAVRLVYELLMMGILLVKHVISINCKLRNQNDGSQADPFSTPDMSAMKATLQQKAAKHAQAAPAAPVDPATPAAPTEPVAAPEKKFCPACGTPLDGADCCPNCGAQQ